MFAFPWGEAGTKLEKENGPDVWQTKFLYELGQLLQKKRRGEYPQAIRLAVASGHGVGKSALIAWLIIWWMATTDGTQCITTANTKAQLDGKTWRELAKWHKLSITNEYFTWTATTYYRKGDAEDSSTNKAIALPWTKERSEAFAGTHETDVLILMDEASGIADEIWEVTEGALTTERCVHIAFGNPTRNFGKFRECFRADRERWRVFRVDSRTARKANKSEIEGWIKAYGLDSDFVRVRVKGEFPRTASNQLISVDLVEEAQARFDSVIMHETDPVIMSVDCARFGDDRSVVGIRVGRKAKILATYVELDGWQLAHRVAEHIQEVQPDAIFIDEVGIGASCYDILVNRLGYDNAVGVNGGLVAADPRLFFNKRAEMWWLMKEWLKNGGAVENDDELKDDLTSPEYGYDGKSRVQLETKDDMKAAGKQSPDKADQLAMTFYMPVAPRVGRSKVVQKMLKGFQAAGSWMSR